MPTSSIVPQFRATANPWPKTRTLVNLMAAEPIQELLARLPNWTQFLEQHQLAPVVTDQSGLFELRLRLVNLRRRLRDGPQAPIRLAFFGPTGAGKSKLFSSMIGKILSESGFRRPFTRRSLYYVHDHWRSLLAALHGDSELHEDEDWRDIIIIDTPDFDSVEVQNRVEAERVFMESDGFLFVTDSLKYADASTWEYLRKIHLAGKVFQVVLNKVNSVSIEESFRERYRKTFGTDSDLRTPIVVPEFPMDDDTLIEADHPAMVKLKSAARDVLLQSSEMLSVQMFASETQGLFRCANELLPEIEQRRSMLAGLRRRLDERFDLSADQLQTRLSSGLEPAVRDEVYQRVLRRIEEIDILRHPRRLLSLPARGIKMLLGGAWPGKSNSEPPPEDDPVATETFYLLESELIQSADDTRNDIRSQRDMTDLLTREKFRALQFSHDELRAKFAEHQEKFKQWVADHARDTAAEITTENKAKFILSQVLFNSVLITAQVQTGGLSPLELGMDGIISPFMAKLIGMAIGNEKVKAFEAEARAWHRESLRAILDSGRKRFVDFLSEAGQGLDELEQQISDILQFQDNAEEFVSYFSANDGEMNKVDQP